jgi:hypothetical protein
MCGRTQRVGHSGDCTIGAALAASPAAASEHREREQQVIEAARVVNRMLPYLKGVHHESNLAYRAHLLDQALAALDSGAPADRRGES